MFVVAEATVMSVARLFSLLSILFLFFFFLLLFARYISRQRLTR